MKMHRALQESGLLFMAMQSNTDDARAYIRVYCLQLNRPPKPFYQSEQM